MSHAHVLDMISQDFASITHAPPLRPPGPFARALLYLPEARVVQPRNVLSLIRDANESEFKPFEAEVAEIASKLGPPGSRQWDDNSSSLTDPGLDKLAPLKQLQKARGTPRELDETLTASEHVITMLADNARPMTRARTQVRNLTEQHRRQQARIEELERLIAAASQTAQPAEPEPPVEEAVKKATKPTMSVDEAIAAEEEALKLLESQIAPMRRAHALRASAARSPKNSPVRSPKVTPKRGTAPSSPTTVRRAQVPTTPGQMPTITNSLVTPHRRAAPTPHNRFSPLHLIGTPRAAPPPSALRRSVRGDDPRPIFPRTTMTPALSRSLNQSLRKAPEPTPAAVRVLEPTPAKDTAVPQAGPTPSRPAAAPLVASPQPPVPAPAPPAPPTPVAAPPPASVQASPSAAPRSSGDNVQTSLPFMAPAVDKIHSVLTDFMRMGGSGVTAEPTPDSTIAQLIKVSNADPTPSGTDPTGAPAITTEAILMAHAVLMILRAGRAGDPDLESNPFVPQAIVKQELAAVASARGWEGADDMAAKAVYRGVGRKLWKIDRKGGGKLHLALV